MKKLLVLLFLIAIGNSVYGQYRITDKGYTQLGDGAYYKHWYESIDGVLFVMYQWAEETPKPYVLVKVPQTKNITNYTVPDGVETIAKGAFQGNKYIQTIRIPTSVYYIGDNAFADCENLKSIEVYPSSNQTISKGDVNEDGEVNISDVNELIDLILGYLREHPEILEQIRK